MRLSTEEKAAITEYICRFAETEPKVPIEKILEPWEKAKSEYLFSIFKDSLIKEFPVKYSRPITEIAQEFSQEVTSSAKFYTRILKFREYLIKNYKGSCEYTDINTNLTNNDSFGGILWELLSADSLLGRIHIYDNNYYKNYIFTYDGKKICFKPLDKTYRVLKKLVYIVIKEEKTKQEYLKLLDELALAASRYKNDQILEGTYCLSIHPLDYMTMSDNENNWGSCMSWLEEGCYRQGTVEMMNSPCIVVGYLKSSSKKLFINHDFSWNSKKWRTLFICDPNFVCSIKAYPFESKELTTFGLKQLVNFENPQSMITFHNNKGESDYIPIFETNKMYNDFGTTTHYMIPKTKKIKDYYNYSGISECMSCGQLDPYLDSEANLCCEDCYSTYRCIVCGEIIHEDDVERDDNDDCYCPYCADHYLRTEAISGLTLNANDMIRVIATPFNSTKELIEEIERIKKVKNYLALHSDAEILRYQIENTTTYFFTYENYRKYVKDKVRSFIDRFHNLYYLLKDEVDENWEKDNS